MSDTLHNFHIPVMGTGHSIDTPIRLAHLGITSVISIIDDLLVERLRKYYTSQYNLPYERISPREDDSRAKRITAYLDMVHDIVEMKMTQVRSLPFFENNEKSRYFELLPDTSSLKKAYQNLLDTEPGKIREKIANELSHRMRPGGIDVNIMVKVDRIDLDKHGKPLGEEFSDAKAALRGFAKSKVESAMVFSSGINQRLNGYMTKYKDFYRNHEGEIKKKIILKVSDFRSAMIQGRYMAKKGLEISEFRIESGLNCGGHAFLSVSFFFNDTATTEIYTLSLHDALPILSLSMVPGIPITGKSNSSANSLAPLKEPSPPITTRASILCFFSCLRASFLPSYSRSEEHTSELQSHSFISYAVFCLKKKK